MSTPTAKIRIMVVDDEPDICLILAHVLRARYEVVVAPNGLEALERLDRYEPDFIVMDVMMPVLDGFDTTRAIKKDMRYSSVPVLFLTARKDNQSVRDALLAGGDMYLEKPFNPPELLARIEELTAKYHVMPRKKRQTVEDVEGFYSGSSDASVSVPENPAGGPSGRPKTLSEQLAEASAEPKLRVLAVDDDSDILAYIKSVLQDDYEVITTIDSENAPDKILAYQPDILLLDIMMPKLNGFHLSHLIRLNRKLRGAKIIFVSSKSDRESVEKAFRLGASDFVEKPFTPEQIQRKIQEVVRKPDFQRSKKRIDYREIMRRETQSQL